MRFEFFLHGLIKTTASSSLSLSPSLCLSLSLSLSLSPSLTFKRDQTCYVPEPAKPVGNGRVNKTSDNVYDFLFDGSPGDVDHYLVTIEGIIDPPARILGSQTKKIPDVQLTPAQLYTYTIVAVNGNGDESEKLEDTFTVGEESKYIHVQGTNYD